MLSVPLFVAALLVAAPDSTPVVRQTDVTRLLSTLSHDSMQGRRTGTIGSHKAARAIAAEMKAIGLEPLGDSGYLQRVPLRSEGGELSVLPSWAAFDTLPQDQRVAEANVVGVLRGSDSTLRDQVILVDAHYDHLGVGTPVGGDSIYNGADDDGSGVVAVIEIARALAAGPRPKRTVVFLATTGEEVGLLGTQWYIAHPALPLDRTVGNLEIEMIGRPDSLAGGSGKGWLTGFERSTVGPTFKAAGLAIVADPRPAEHFFERSDNIAFAQRGIPAHTLSSYNMHTDYHQPSDDASHADLAHMTAVIQTATQAVKLLANGDVPTWVEGGRP